MTNSALARMDALMLPKMKRKGQSDAAIYRPRGRGVALPCTVLLDRDVQYQDGTDAGVLSTSDVITAYHADIGPGVPEEKSTFTIGRETWIVDRITANDESRCVMLVTRKDC